MLTRIIILLLVFGGIFYLTNLFYPFMENLLGRWQKKRIDKISPKLDKMFLDVSLKRLMLIDVVSPALSGLIGFIFTKNPWLALACAAAGLAIPTFVVKHLEAARRRKFSSQIVDGLMILSSSLKAGLSLLQSLEVLVEEISAPMSQEFGLVVRQMQMGVPLEEAMDSLKKRMKVDELDMVVTATMVARETGGDLTETFSRLANAIQERNKLIGRVNALCVQGKLQGAIMCFIPILFALFVSKANPHFFDAFLKDDFGRGLLIYAAISEVLGIIFMRILSRIDI